MKRVIPIVICLALLLSGCKGDGKTFTFMIYSTPKNFDPLFASTSDEQTILDNTMEGLFTFDENGDIVPAGASEMSISSDKKTYTITLKENILWSNDQPITAHDYVFAFERMFSPSNTSPHASEFFIISGAREISQGKNAHLGVSAPDDHTIVFTLTEPVEYFTELLCSSSAFPCNRDFFISTSGKYGLSKETSLFNGPFVISNIKEDAIYLKKNQLYRERDKVHLSYVSIPIGKYSDSREQGFAGNRTDASYLSATELASLGAGGNHLLSSENTTWTLLFSDTGTMSNNNLRKALAHSCNPSEFMEEGAVDTTPAMGIIPPSVTYSGKSYRDDVGNILPEYSAASANSFLEKYMAQSHLSKLPTITILCPDNDRIKKLLDSQLQIWQRDIGVFINVKVMDQNDIIRTVSTGGFDIVLVPLSPSYNSPLSILNKFSSSGGIFKNKNFDALVLQPLQFPSQSEKTRLYKECEEMLMDHLPCLPLFYEKNYLICKSGFDGIFTSPSFTRIYFRHIR